MSIDRCDIVKSIITPHLADGETMADAPEVNGVYTVTLNLPTQARAEELGISLTSAIAIAGLGEPGARMTSVEGGARFALELSVEVGGVRSLSL